MDREWNEVASPGKVLETEQEGDSEGLREVVLETDPGPGQVQDLGQEQVRGRETSTEEVLEREQEFRVSSFRPPEGLVETIRDTPRTPSLLIPGRHGRRDIRGKFC